MNFLDDYYVIPKTGLTPHAGSNPSVALEGKDDHDRKLQNIYEKSLRHYQDIS